MLSELLALTLVLTNKGALAPEHARSLAEDAAEVAETSDPLFDGPNGRARTARLLVVWSTRESAGVASVLGGCADDKKKSVNTCTSFGRMQMTRVWTKHFGVSVEAILLDGKLALRLALAAMRSLRVTCKGDVKGALRAYASGQCQGRAHVLVENRCKESGGC